MKRYIKSAQSIQIEFTLDVDVVHRFKGSRNLAASQELDSLDVTALRNPIVNFPENPPLDVKADYYINFIEFVNKVDELLELRHFEVLGERDILNTPSTTSESVYRGILFTVLKHSDGARVHGKIMNTLRIAGHKATRSSRRTRQAKLEQVATSPEARMHNSGRPLVVGEFESIHVHCSVETPSASNVSNKEFYSYVDALQYIDQLLDEWESVS